MLIQKFKQLRCRLVTWSTHTLALPMIRLVVQPPTFPYSIDELQQMPATSMGNRLYAFLQHHDLHLLPDYESHDVKHALLGYPATEEGEASMQFFFFGNGQRSFPVLITVITGLIIMPDYYASFRVAYKRGRQTPRLAGTNWFSLLPHTYSSLLQQLKIAPNEHSNICR